MKHQEEDIAHYSKECKNKLKKSQRKYQLPKILPSNQNPITSPVITLSYKEILSQLEKNYNKVTNQLN
jgi:hypothetical protein